MHHQSTKYLNFTLYSLFLMIMTYIIVSIRSQQCSYCPHYIMYYDSLVSNTTNMFMLVILYTKVLRSVFSRIMFFY